MISYLLLLSILFLTLNILIFLLQKSVSDEEFYSIMSKWSEQHFQDAIKESAAEKHNLKLVRQNIANIKRLMRTFHSQPRLLEAIFDKYDFHDAKSSRTQVRRRDRYRCGLCFQL